MENEEILTTPQVAKLLGVSATAVNIWLKAGDFPDAYRLHPERPHSPWRIPKHAVDQFIEQRRKARGYFYVPVAAQKSDQEPQVV